MKIYPSDWMGDSRLRMVSMAARGLWFEMLCLMHQAPERGRLAIPAKMVGKLTGCADADALLAELEAVGITVRDERGFVSARMVHETHIRSVRSEAGGRGVESRLLKQMHKQTVKQTLVSGISGFGSVSLEGEGSGEGKPEPPTMPDDGLGRDVPEVGSVSFTVSIEPSREALRLAQAVVLPPDWTDDTRREVLRSLAKWVDWSWHNGKRMSGTALAGKIAGFLAAGWDGPRLVRAIRESMGNGWKTIVEPSDGQPGRPKVKLIDPASVPRGRK